MDKVKEFENQVNFWQQALVWAQQFDYVFFSPPCRISYPFGGFASILAVGDEDIGFPRKGTYFQHVASQSGWLFGVLGYDLKNEIELLTSRHPPLLDMGKGCFFRPSVLIEFRGYAVKVHAREPDEVFEQIQQSPLHSGRLKVDLPIPTTNKASYIANVQKIKNLIAEGEVYELNYCIGYRHKAEIENPAEFYIRLNTLSSNPFSCFFKQRQQYVFCASPERFLRRKGTELLSQPIKGTARRSTNPIEDQMIKNQLRQSPKEQAENMMIVDLVRNDLARVSQVGSVRVAEMFGVYSFPQVHQLISSILSESDATFDLIMAALFPMGSMTGAPKIRAMQLIDDFEGFSRGYFSGAAGYICPNGDFDFNVLIRSVLWDSNTRCLAYAAGGAITWDSDPEAEYREIESKLQAINTLLGNKDILKPERGLE